MENEKSKANYTPELTANVVERYAAGESIESIATAIGKSKRSVQGKLVSLKLYKPAEKVRQTNADEGPTKAAWLETLKSAGFSGAALEGLKGATKPALAEVYERTRAVSA
jgi:hypothetical protein